MMKRLFLLCIAALVACSSSTPAPSPERHFGAALSGFPTATQPVISSNETYTPLVATALNTFAAQAIADLTTLNTTSGTTGKARAVITALPGAYTGTTTGVLSASAAGAIAAQNGVTLVAGDVAWLAAGATNITAAADSGPWVVTDPGAASSDAATARYVLTRPTWWSHGSVIPVGAEVTIGGEDTLFGGSKWHTFAAKGKVVDTDDPAAYPDEVTQQVTLSTGGLKAITNIPLRSATASSCIPTLAAVGGTMTGVVSLQQGVITPGALGTATVSVFAAGTALAAIGTGPTPTVNVTCIN